MFLNDAVLAQQRHDKKIARLIEDTNVEDFEAKRDDNDDFLFDEEGIINDEEVYDDSSEHENC
jgi:hypothetical protein